MNPTNAYCEALGIQAPRLEVARQSPDANYYSLLIVALLERGEPITLEEAARRFEEAGVAPAQGLPSIATATSTLSIPTTTRPISGHSGSVSGRRRRLGSGSSGGNQVRCRHPTRR
jgi:hypothetical protein